MAKKQRKPAEPMASEAQKKRLDELGTLAHGDAWLDAKLKLYREPMTPERAQYFIGLYQKILGTKV